MAKSDKTVKRGVYLYIDGKEIKNDINSIDLEMKRLQRDIKEMTRGSEEYNRTMAKIQHLQGILKQHRQEIKGITTETKKATVSIGSMVQPFRWSYLVRNRFPYRFYPCLARHQRRTQQVGGVPGRAESLDRT